MTENKHTQEPWHLCEVENETGRIKHLVPVDAEKMSLLTIVENDQATFAAIYNDDDARRIVACVNACAGIPTGALEDMVTPIRQHLNSADIHAAKLVKQRDELLAALEKFIAWNKAYPSSRIYSDTAIRVIAKELDQIAEQAEAARASAKGEQ